MGGNGEGVVSGDDGSEGDVSGESDASGEDAEAEEIDLEEAVLDFAACMRDNGLPDFADPTLDANGNVQMGRLFAGPGVRLGSVEFREAFAACRHHLEGVPSGKMEVASTRPRYRTLSSDSPSACGKKESR